MNSENTQPSSAAKKKTQRYNKGERRPVLESNGYLGRLRATADKICEKYLASALEEKNSLDEVKQQMLLQYAEHYARLAAQSNGANKQSTSERAPEKGAVRRFYKGHAKKRQPDTSPLVSQTSETSKPAKISTAE